MGKAWLGKFSTALGEYADDPANLQASGDAPPAAAEASVIVQDDAVAALLESGRVGRTRSIPPAHRRVALASELPFTLEDATYDRLWPRRQATPAASVQPCVHLIAERVSLPTAGAIVPVAPCLPPAWRDRLARPDGLLRADCRTAFGFPVRPGDPEQLDAASVGRMIPQQAFLICRSEYRKPLGFLRQVGLVTFRDPRTLNKASRDRQGFGCGHARRGQEARRSAHAARSAAAERD